MKQTKGGVGGMMAIFVLIVIFADVFTKFMHETLSSLCWAKYDTPACHERLKAQQEE